MAEALVSILLDRLTSIIPQEGEQEETLEEGVKEEVQNLTDILRDIQAVLDDAERRQLTEPTAKRWLDKLKDVCYDTDNVLDEWNTAVLRMQTEVFSSIPSFFCCSQVALRRNIAIKIKELNKKLRDIVNQRSKFNFALTSDKHLALKSDNERFERPIATSFVDESEVFGRDQDKNTIVNMLLSESTQGPTLRTISIVGMRGIGKTTLAQLVFTDDVVKAHFQKRIWVRVLYPFDEIRIAKAILETLTYEPTSISRLDILLQVIHNSIEGKKFLLVLDDLWIEDSTKWESLKTSLKRGSPGSRILVTTREQRAADIIGTTNMFLLRLLSKDECWSLFSQVAFSGRTREERENLEGIGRRIIEKCYGLPLAAKVLGSLLCFKKTREDWLSVVNNDIFKEVEVPLFPALLLSYCDLPSTMRQCFLYCAIFPNGYEIDKDMLIKLWMAQGYLKVSGVRDMEMVGEEYFDIFVGKSCFQDVRRDSSGRIITCQVNGTWHEFARFLTKKECSVNEVNDCNRLKLNVRYLNVRHSMFILGGDVSIFAPIKYVKNLCSLIVEYTSLPSTGATAFQVLDQFTCLRAFDLSACYYHKSPPEKLPNGIEKLIHLRYLNLAFNYALKELSETVCDLCNLQSLNVSYCRSLKNLPRGLGRLINLRHLEISSTDVSFMPRGVERLTSLRTLDTFYVSSGGNVNEAATLEELKNLNYLRGNLLIMGLGKVRDVDEVMKAQLQNKKHLIGLILDFGLEEEEKAEGRMINDEQVMEAIQPPPKLEALTIRRYEGRSLCPNWMMLLTHLKKVFIQWCSNCEALPPLGKLSSLESLEIWGMPDVKRVGNELLGIESEANKNAGPSNTSSSLIASFPKLEYLACGDMWNWEEWEDYGMRRRMGEEDITTATTNITIMPRLHSLVIYGCPKLKALPHHLLHKCPSLQKLEIIGSRILSERYYNKERKRKGEEWPNISHIPNILIDGREVQKDGMQPLPISSSESDSEQPNSTAPPEH